ncbi:MAG: GNAT family N-acetyltransferase [Bacteroidia bacterium]
MNELEGNIGGILSHRRKVGKAIVEAIPADIRWIKGAPALEQDYPHPWHWAGYELKTRYTYRLNLERGFEAVEQGFGSDTRYDVRKAQGAGLSVSEESDIDALMALVRENAASGKLLLKPHEEELLPRLAAMLLEQGLGKLSAVRGSDGAIQGMALVGSFGGKSFYLFSAQSPAHSSGGGMTLLLSEAIRRACATDNIFDFEGSMIEGIEGFFRGFGGRPVPYLMIEKNALPLPIRWIRKLR